YQRINERVERMMEAGLQDEARSVYPFKHLNSLNTVGYKELFAYFDGNCTLDEAVDLIKRNSRKYARKQLTWFRRDNEITWFEPEQIQ
ncbi:MAG: tRNA dimethylallyltransferase, partial [Bacteroidota bacterium]|nr:tRNA dimethylallyltransferase [Bacteroidota bacterium]